jgi:hypothetical protein
MCLRLAQERGWAGLARRPAPRAGSARGRAGPAYRHAAHIEHGQHSTALAQGLAAGFTERFMPGGEFPNDTLLSYRRWTKAITRDSP